EDGIRDRTVTGVQTCALPISDGGAAGGRERPRPPRAVRPSGLREAAAARAGAGLAAAGRAVPGRVAGRVLPAGGGRALRPSDGEIGRASCRGRVDVGVGGGWG